LVAGYTIVCIQTTGLFQKFPLVFKFRSSIFLWSFHYDYWGTNLLSLDTEGENSLPSLQVYGAQYF